MYVMKSEIGYGLERTFYGRPLVHIIASNLEIGSQFGTYIFQNKVSG